MAAVRSVKQLHCPRCGAPLTWKGHVNVVECRYCKTHVVVETGQRTQAPAGAIAHKPVPAVVWVVGIGATFALALVVGVVALWAGFPYVNAGDQLVSILLRDRREPVTAEGFHKLLQTLASCK